MRDVERFLSAQGSDCGIANVNMGPSGAEIGRGLVAYDAGESGQIIGRNSRDIEAILGMPGQAEMIHRDDMVLSGE